MPSAISASASNVPTSLDQAMVNILMPTSAPAWLKALVTMAAAGAG
jgi:hypothetical protein